MIETVINSLGELMNYVDGFTDLCYRGQSNSSWGLVPTIFRNIAKLDRPLRRKEIISICQYERDIYREFTQKARRFSSEYSTVDWHSDWEVLCLAQHFGTPTRLLDWTKNLAVAILFAVMGSETSDGVVWCLEMKSLPEMPYDIVGRRHEGAYYRIKTIPTEDISFFTERSRIPTKSSRPSKNLFGIIQPPDIDARITNQQSLFSVYISFKENEKEFVWDHLSYILELEKRESRTLLHKLIIPVVAKRDLGNQIRKKLGFDVNSVFPDLVGLGLYFALKRDEDFALHILSGK